MIGEGAYGIRLPSGCSTVLGAVMTRDTGFGCTHPISRCLLTLPRESDGSGITAMNRRRRFLTSMAATVGTLAFDSESLGGKRNSAPNLVPATLSRAPNYWCTWAIQNYLYGQKEQAFDANKLEGSEGTMLARALLNEQVVLGPRGWSKTLHARVRGELFLLLDDGWEEGGTASFELDRVKFSSFSGSAQERLHALNSEVQADGWRALALWCRNPPGNTGDEQCVGWSKFAGIPYLKIDGGDQSGSMARARGRQRASMTFEHIHRDGCLNGDWRADGRFGVQPWGSPRLQVLRNTDVYRTYDTTCLLGVPTTLDRVAELLNGAAGHKEIRALLNVEDEAYIAAVLGCSMGLLRHPLQGLRPGDDPDVFLPPPRQIKRRMDEVVRAIRWQRIAPPYAAGMGTVLVDTHSLTDEWIFRHGETFASDIVGARVRQGAPARIARNTDLPAVSSEGALPYVASARFPTGAAAIGAFERVSAEKQVFQPKAQVRWHVGDAPGPFGIFGRFDSLTLVLNRSFRPGRIIAQDLAANSSIDITDSVRVRGSEIVLPGALIDRIGRASGSPGDSSMPGLVLAI